MGRWKGGKRIHQKGYIEITYGKYRWWKEHRMFVDLCCKEHNPWIGNSGLKELEAKLNIIFEVHHIDHMKQNNTNWNLIMIDKRLHSAFNGRWLERDQKGKFIPGAPDWVTKDFGGINTLERLPGEDDYI